jgi:hypothetical protein
MKEITDTDRLDHLIKTNSNIQHYDFRLRKKETPVTIIAYYEDDNPREAIDEAIRKNEGSYN